MRYDATRFIEPDMDIYPGDPPFVQTPHYTMEAHSVRLHKLEMGNHTGTHVDAPSHFLKDGVSLDEVGLDALIGPCRVVHQPAPTVALLEALALQPGERVLLAVDGPLSEAAAAYLAGRKLALVGTSNLTVGPAPQHHAILGSGAIIVEGLVLDHIPDGCYRMVALPLRLKQGNGAPARVILEQIDLT